jgi:sugar phosphate isomerase/epimerase
MKLGISSYSFTWAVGVKGSLPEKPFNEIDLLDAAEHLGLHLVQIADNMPVDSMSDDRRAALVEKANKLGISIEVGANQLTTARLERYIGIAEQMKSRILRFSIDGPDYKPQATEVISIVRNSLPELKKRGIILALENHERLFTHDFRKMMEAISSDAVGICLDCANSLGLGEGFHEVVSALAPYTVNFHLKEVFIKRKYHMMGFDIEGRPFGEGSLPLRWMLDQLPPSCKTAILEQWTPPEDDLKKTVARERQWAEKSIGYLKPYFD